MQYLIACRWTTLTPKISRPSSVSVPVLSKQMTSNFPPTLTLWEGQCIAIGLSVGHVACLWGLMQKICFFFSLDRAKLVPMDKVAGRAGGTTIVIKSKARTKIKCHASYLMLARVRTIVSRILTLSLTKFTKEAMKPIAATPAMTSMYRKASL